MAVFSPNNFPTWAQKEITLGLATQQQFCLKSPLVWKLLFQTLMIQITYWIGGREVFFFFFLMTELFGYQQSISNFTLCTVTSYSTSFKFHFSWCHKKMEEQEIRIISFGVYLLTFIFKIWQPIHALDMSLWLFQVIQQDPCFLHLNKNQKLDIISISLLHIIASHQYAKLGREDAFDREPLNSEEKMVWFLVESGWS